MSSRLRAVRIFTLAYEKLMFLARRPSSARPPRTCHCALACTACSFLNKTALSSRRRAHFAFQRLLSRHFWIRPIMYDQSGFARSGCTAKLNNGHHLSYLCSCALWSIYRLSVGFGFVYSSQSGPGGPDTELQGPVPIKT